VEASVDEQTVATIVTEVEERGSLLDVPGVPPPSEPRFAPPLLRVKYALDRDLAALILVFLAPLLMFVAILVRITSPGPVLFRQQRVGEDGRGFVMFKFRSMRLATKLVRFEPAPGIAPGGVEGEDRRTAVGRVIRVLSLDELPQLLNVLRGEMSLVGPRPERPRYVERFSRELPGYAERHLVRPGITGWAQVHGCRGATPIKNRLELDREYIQFWSLWLDLKIMVRTAVGLAGMVIPHRRGEHVEAVIESIGRRHQSPAWGRERASDR
jgi:lipopolysaccharide/colanic/teichoic acid biosynthesis glycosyltransferase